jgi:hypothetical protein
MQSSKGAFVLCALACVLSSIQANAAEDVIASAEYRGTWEVVKFDVSPPLRDIKPLPIPDGMPYGGLMVDPESDWIGPLGPQDFDMIVQPELGPWEIPAPVVSFDGPSNISGVSPPDPVGDVGPNHYVAMSNLYFQIFNKSGTSLYGPAANNTLWAGFGGNCQTSNDGDPIVLHDQLSDRWILTQFTASSPYYNCVAVSTTSDPTGSYYRYAFSTGANFPDYPKYGVWPDAIYISTREFAGSSFAGVGAYAINRAQIVAGNPTPTVISFLATPGGSGGAFNVGDGLLPSDLDGDALPPAGSPNYFMGSMDNGATYGAPQDALTLWKFTADFTTPANSTFVLTHTIPILPYDTMFAPCSGRSCIPQPGTSNKIDILSYRQRPMHRLAYRNFGTHESLVTNQSVEAVANIAGIRWWEIRDPDGSPVIFQEGTYAPGATDGIHRWMGSIAMDQSGNMALGYSASDATSTYPSSWYSGRLVGDPLGTMPQGEAAVIDGTGSQTGSQRWGDYTSLNIDPVDDCTFWYVNQYVPTTSSVGWRLRIGAFVFDDCGCDLVITPPVASAGVGGPNLILVGWNDSATPEISEYRVYRSFGGAPYELVATVPDSSPGSGGGAGYTYQDYDVSGGTEYFYVVRSSDGGACLSDPSNEVSAVATGDCTLPPLFGGVESVTNPALANCTLELGWTAGTSRCSGNVSYNVYRSTSQGFIPSPANLVASGVAGTGYTDGGPLQSQVRHYYVVRGVDSVNGAEEQNTTEGSGVPTGPFSIGTWTDDAGDTGDATLTQESPWSVAATGGNLGPQVYLTGTYTNSLCAGITTPSMMLGSGSTLTFWSKYQIETSWDKGVVEISADGGSSWETVPVNYPGSSTNTSDACQLPTGSYFTGSGTPAWAQYTASLATWDGQDVQLRWRLSTDGSVTYQGWWVDDISITNVMVPSDCDSGEPPLFADDFEDGTTSAWSSVLP